jgi:cell division septation protein DedD
MIELVISFQKINTDVVVNDKIVQCQKIENVVRALGAHGYHVFTYHTNAPEEDVKRINIGGCIDENEQSRQVC